MPRDDFKQSVIDTLARRAGGLCCNPECRDPLTWLPHSAPHRSVNLGVAAHICAAAPGGPRYDPTQSPAERSSIENAIWLCQRCAAEIDRDVPRYDVEQLQTWKKQHAAILTSASMRTALISIDFRSRPLADAAIAAKLTADSQASSTTSHLQRVLDASLDDLDDILTELPHVTNPYELYHIVRPLPYIYPIAMRVREFAGQAKEPSKILSMADSILVEAWSSAHKETLGMLATLLSTQNELWIPNKRVLDKINSLCLHTLSDGDYSQIGIMEPLMFAVGRKGLRSTHQKFLRASIETDGWRNADIERIGKYYQTEEVQLSSIDRHLHDKFRTGLLRVNDLPRLIHYLTSPSVKLTAILNAKARQLTTEFLMVLQDCGEDRLLQYVLKEILDKLTNRETLF